jgi:hypothetical protein
LDALFGSKSKIPKWSISSVVSRKPPKSSVFGTFYIINEPQWPFSHEYFNSLSILGNAATDNDPTGLPYYALRGGGVVAY